MFTSFGHIFAQSSAKTKALTFREFQILKKKHKQSDDDCINTAKYTVAQRLRMYPFSKAIKVIAVSFPAMERNHQVFIDDNSTPAAAPDTAYEAGLHVLDGKLNYCSIIEAKTLTADQISRLTDIIYNTAYRKKGFNIENHYKCFNPRNAVLFYDEKGKIFDYVEICFECKNAESLSENLDVGTLCNQKYDMLKKFLTNVGLVHGTEILD